MNRILLISNVVLLVALVVLYVLFFTGKKAVSFKEKDTTFLSSDSAKYQLLPVAYIDVDSLLQKYDFAKEQNEILLTKQENARLTLAQKAAEFEKDYIDFQKKLQNNVYATQQRAEQEGNRLAKKQEDIRNLEVRLTNELLAEQQKINNQLRDSLNLTLESYRIENGYQIIFSNTMHDNILSADARFNITDEIVDLLNARFKKK